MARADLGGLGEKEGPTLNYHWEPPSRIPPLLPWLAMLLLLAARPNRFLGAWWILAPVGFVAGLATLLQLDAGSLFAEDGGDFLKFARALGFGIGAVWLVSPWLRRSHRVLTFLLMLPVLTGFGLLALFALRSPEAETDQAWREAIGTLAGASALSVSLSLAGLLCWRRYGRVRFSLWLVLSTLAFWLLVYGGFWMFGPVGGSNGATVGEFLGAVLAVTGISLGTLFPFVTLSLANGFYHERLKALLHMGREAAPPVIGKVDPASATAPT